MSIKKVICVLFCFTLLLSVSACGSTGKANAVSVEETADSKIVLDYGDAESFEAALNRGENLEGKTVSFYAKEIHPDSALGYNVWSGEHLNFVSSRNPDISVGDTVTVKATTIKNLLGSWIIDYEKLMLLLVKPLSSQAIKQQLKTLIPQSMARKRRPILKRTRQLSHQKQKNYLLNLLIMDGL